MGLSPRNLSVLIYRMSPFRAVHGDPVSTSTVFGKEWVFRDVSLLPAKPPLLLGPSQQAHAGSGEGSPVWASWRSWAGPLHLRSRISAEDGVIICSVRACFLICEVGILSEESRYVLGSPLPPVLKPRRLGPPLGPTVPHAPPARVPACGEQSWCPGWGRKGS